MPARRRHVRFGSGDGLHGKKRTNLSPEGSVLGMLSLFLEDFVLVTQPLAAGKHSYDSEGGAVTRVACTRSTIGLVEPAGIE